MFLRFLKVRRSLVLTLAGDRISDISLFTSILRNTASRECPVGLCGSEFALWGEGVAWREWRRKRHRRNDWKEEMETFVRMCKNRNFCWLLCHQTREHLTELCQPCQKAKRVDRCSRWSRCIFRKVLDGIYRAGLIWSICERNSWDLRGESLNPALISHLLVALTSDWQLWQVKEIVRCISSNSDVGEVLVEVVWGVRPSEKTLLYEYASISLWKKQHSEVSHWLFSYICSEGQKIWPKNNVMINFISIMAHKVNSC